MEEGRGLEDVHDRLPHAVLVSAHSKASHSRSLLELELHLPESKKETKYQNLEPASTLKVYTTSCDRAQPAKAPTAKAEDLCSIPRTYTVEGENPLLKIIL